MNPTSTCLANHIVDIEAGPLAGEYFAWNFNSGMAAIDATLSHLVGYQDVVLSSRNIYGGAYQLLHDWFGKASNLDIACTLVRRLHRELLPKGPRTRACGVLRAAGARPADLRVPRVAL